MSTNHCKNHGYATTDLRGTTHWSYFGRQNPYRENSVWGKSTRHYHVHFRSPRHWRLHGITLVMQPLLGISRFRHLGNTDLRRRAYQETHQQQQAGALHTCLSWRYLRGQSLRCLRGKWLQTQSISELGHIKKLIMPAKHTNTSQNWSKNHVRIIDSYVSWDLRQYFSFGWANGVP